jgi:Dynamin family
MAALPSRPARPASKTTPDDLPALLRAASEIVRTLSPGGATHGRQLKDLAARLSAGRLRIAVLGQFKRGKSTFLNALLGYDLLPAGVVPLTAIPAFLRWGPENLVNISFLDGQPSQVIAAGNVCDIAVALRRYATEEGNPRNRARVARVEVSLPAPLLVSGIELIDTPGIGSTLRQNTDAALEVLPECDAAFFVVSVDPPITAAELDYLDRVSASISPILFVLNKVDYLCSAERRSALDFLRETLRGHSAGLADQPIFELSARNALAARLGQDEAAVEESGLGAIERYQAETLLEAKRDILHAAIVQKAAAVLELARADAALGVRALEMPIGDLAARARQFGEAVTDIERQRVVAADLLSGERQRMRQAIEQRAEALRSVARTSLLTLVDAAFARTPAADQAEATANALIAEAIPQLFQAALERAASEVAGELDEALDGHTRRAEEVISAVRSNAAQLFDIPYTAREAAESFVSAREPYWVTQKWHDTLLPLTGGIFGRLLPTRVARARAKRRLATEVESLVARNIENLRWATLQNIDEAFRRFSGWFDERLGEAIEATRGAIAVAQEKRRQRAGDAERGLRQLRTAQERIAATLDRLNSLRRSPQTRAIEPLLSVGDARKG